MILSYENEIFHSRGRTESAIPGELSFGLFVGNASVVLGEFQIFEADSHRFSIRIYAS